jgi:hypothetical protein
VYCPRCGASVAQSPAGDFFCDGTGAALSAHTARALVETFIERSREPSVAPLMFSPGGSWWCPGCGVSMAVDSNSVRCPQCQRCLNEFVYPLVEFNPHP